jgi:hypothetical protein
LFETITFTQNEFAEAYVWNRKSANRKAAFANPTPILP